MVEYHPIFAEDLSRLHQSGIFLGYALHARRIWNGDILVADVEEVEQMDASEIYAKRLNAKEVLTPKSGEKLIFPVADGTVKLFWTRSGSENIHLNPGSPRPGREQSNLQRDSDGCSSTPRQDSSWYDGETKYDFWSVSRYFIYRHHVEPRVKLCVPTEESEIHWRYQTTTDTTLDVMSEKHVEDYWNVDGDRELSDTWTSFTKV